MLKNYVNFSKKSSSVQYFIEIPLISSQSQYSFCFCAYFSSSEIYRFDSMTTIYIRWFFAHCDEDKELILGFEIQR
jgi:hypothetical protein